MEHVLALIESGHETDESMFDLEADEEEYYNEFYRAFDNEIIGAVLAQVEPSYEDDDYDFIDHNDEQFKDIYNMWCDGGPMAHKKAELEFEFFTGSAFPGKVCGYNSNPKKVHPAVLREKKRRPTSNAPDNESKEILEIVVQRVSELLNKGQSHIELVLETFVKIISRTIMTYISPSTTHETALNWQKHSWSVSRK